MKKRGEPHSRNQSIRTYSYIFVILAKHTNFIQFFRRRYLISQYFDVAAESTGFDTMTEKCSGLSIK